MRDGRVVGADGDQSTMPAVADATFGTLTEPDAGPQSQDLT